MYDAILFATDGSDAAAAALDHAITAAEAHGATLHVLSVADERLALAADDTGTTREDLNERAGEAVEDAADQAISDGIDVVTAVRTGVPFREIIADAEDEAVDLVVVGTHGREGREKRVNMGSTAERVVNRAERPVLVVRD
ncbi:universal stress protein [Halobacteriales archaeon QS_4_70_19]|nr:MAG: universal stress protein [Halobacteriales archaeon QS_4_70_19]